ncbi:MAG: hypothetical protein A2790_22260 [Phenylobacterium sp. RIFCSPHIGHO2_01_FULL_69_31]|uniref:hypothetical protein n=1 Tax=Phenylobacterium sp. RIFCSPHIGHO2_01_FULL_69_31 TaxID=1801944 RepID=UPI0008D86444|nr:hypothetical protein [Phenylobacterium sp. RIFCSPHIGHO2_01_FULL_69_31]OHB27516.1 MAG: hypothetical protein A2790_22260 [Phenylobacterium sp. RIFCSPHIGHO2_01_FULL_69_31]
MAVPSGVWVEINDANLRNDHIYLNAVLDYFPESARGGSSAADAATDLLKIEFVPGQTIQTDIAGGHNFLRARSEVRDFFERSGAASGDRVLIEKTGSRQFRFTLCKVNSRP